MSLFSARRLCLCCNFCTHSLFLSIQVWVLTQVKHNHSSVSLSLSFFFSPHVTMMMISFPLHPFCASQSVRYRAQQLILTVLFCMPLFWVFCVGSHWLNLLLFTFSVPYLGLWLSPSYPTPTLRLIRTFYIYVGKPSAKTEQNNRNMLKGFCNVLPLLLLMLLLLLLLLQDVWRGDF